MHRCGRTPQGIISPSDAVTAIVRLLVLRDKKHRIALDRKRVFVCGGVNLAQDLLNGMVPQTAWHGDGEKQQYVRQHNVQYLGTAPPRQASPRQQAQRYAAVEKRKEAFDVLDL